MANAILLGAINVSGLPPGIVTLRPNGTIVEVVLTLETKETA